VNIGIIGYGVIGKAIGDTFTSGNVHINDVRDIDNVESNVIVFDKLEDLVCSNVEIIFLCVPSPTVDGKFDSSYITNVMDQIEKIEMEIPPIVLKSTTPPDIVQELFSKYSNLSIYNPEFLRQNSAKQDLLDMEKHYVWANSERDHTAFKSYINASNCQKTIVRFPSLQKLSLFKYASNTYNATRVTFANCIYQMFEAIEDEDMDYSEFIDTFGDFLELNYKRWGHNLRVPGPDGHKGYGGACLPKDTQALIEYANRVQMRES